VQHATHTADDAGATAGALLRGEGEGEEAEEGSMHLFLQQQQKQKQKQHRRRSHGGDESSSALPLIVSFNDDMMARENTTVMLRDFSLPEGETQPEWPSARAHAAPRVCPSVQALVDAAAALSADELGQLLAALQR
jgi:hypothetical protein